MALTVFYSCSKASSGTPTQITRSLEHFSQGGEKGEVGNTRGGTPYNGLYGEAPPKRGTFFRLQVYKRVPFHMLQLVKSLGKSVI